MHSIGRLFGFTLQNDNETGWKNSASGFHCMPFYSLAADGNGHMAAKCSAMDGYVQETGQRARFLIPGCFCFTLIGFFVTVTPVTVLAAA
jgi:hypothetical protein